MATGSDGERRFELPDDLEPEDERAVLMALERYFSAENPKPAPWVLQGRIDATGFGALQVRRFAFSEALHRAVQKGNVERAKELLSWGADPEYPLEFGTPLEEARKSGNKQMVELLESK